MMPGELDGTYEIIYTDPAGNKLITADDFVFVEVTRVANWVGVATVGLPGDFPLDTILLDGRQLISRNGRLLTETVWFTRKLTRKINSDGSRLITTTGYDGNYLLGSPSGQVGRVAANDAGSSQAKKTGKIDDMMKTIVREQIGSLVVDSNRDLSAFVSVASDASASSVVTTKGFSRRIVLAVLQELYQTSQQLGDPIYFDLMAPTAKTLEFRTYPGLRGVDRSSSVVFSPEYGNIEEAEIVDFDAIEEVTVAYAGGQGLEADRKIGTGSDSKRLNETIFNRRERFVNASHEEMTVSQLNDVAKAAVFAGRRGRLLKAKIRNIPQTIYDVHYSFGDRVTVELDGDIFTPVIDAITFRKENGRETIDVWAVLDE